MNLPREIVGIVSQDSVARHVAVKVKKVVSQELRLKV